MSEGRKGSSMLAALHAAWVPLVRAGVHVATFGLDERAYLVALWEALPEVRNPRPGARSAMVWLPESFTATFADPPSSEVLGPVREIFVTPEQEREFRWHGITIRREPREVKS